MNFRVTALIFTLLVTFSCSFPQSIADELDVVSGVLPPWPSPVKYMTGSAKMIKQDTPLPEQTGFSVSWQLFAGMNGVEIMILLGLKATLESVPSGSIDISGSLTPVHVAALLEILWMGPLMWPRTIVWAIC